jgi:hypothetical protein
MAQWWLQRRRNLFHSKEEDYKMINDFATKDESLCSSTIEVWILNEEF